MPTTEHVSDPEDHFTVADPAESRLWQVLVLGGLVAVAVVAVAAGPPGWRWAAVPLVAALIAWYLSLGWVILRSSKTHHDSPRALVFGAGVVLLFVPVTTISPTASIGLFVIAPLLYMTGGVAIGTGSLIALLVLPDLLRAALGLLPWSAVLLALGPYAVILLFSYWFGSWITRVVVQSEERAELITELRRTRAEATRLSQETGAMAERERLAREIHDTLAQGFTSIITLAQAVETELDSDRDAARRHVALMRETAQENLAEARALVTARTPAPLESDSLEASLRRLTARIGEELDIEARAEVSAGGAPLPPPIQVGLLRSAQEALANIRRHAEATSVTVTLHTWRNGARLTVTDDGRGFDPATSQGHGLANLRHRAEQVGGTFRVESAPGRGTRICVEVPVPSAEKEPA